MMAVIRSSETSVLTRPTRLHVPEYSIVHSHCREHVTALLVVSFAVQCKHGDYSW
jgi:hypothetical protein